MKHTHVPVALRPTTRPTKRESYVPTFCTKCASYSSPKPNLYTGAVSSGLENAKQKTYPTLTLAVQERCSSYTYAPTPLT